MSRMSELDIDRHNEELDRMSAASPDLIAFVQAFPPEKTPAAITLLQLLLTDPGAPVITDAPLTDRERYMLALISTLKAAPEAAFVPPMHPALEALQEADDVLTDFSADAWQTDPTDRLQIAARYDAARDHVEKALNLTRLAIKLDHPTR